MTESTATGVPGSPLTAAGSVRDRTEAVLKAAFDPIHQTDWDRLYNEIASAIRQAEDLGRREGVAPLTDAELDAVVEWPEVHGTEAARLVAEVRRLRAQVAVHAEQGLVAQKHIGRCHEKINQLQEQVVELSDQKQRDADYLLNYVPKSAAVMAVNQAEAAMKERCAKVADTVASQWGEDADGKAACGDYAGAVKSNHCKQGAEEASAAIRALP